MFRHLCFWMSTFSSWYYLLKNMVRKRIYQPSLTSLRPLYSNHNYHQILFCNQRHLGNNSSCRDRWPVLRRIWRLPRRVIVTCEVRYSNLPQCQFNLEMMCKWMSLIKLILRRNQLVTMVMATHSSNYRLKKYYQEIIFHKWIIL